MNKSNIGIIAFLTIFAFCCTKDNTPSRPIENDELWDCYRQNKLGNTQIKEALTGHWKWIYSENYWAWGKGRNTENENAQLELLPDSTLNYWVEDSIEFTTKWMVITIEGLYRIDLDSSITEIYGTIMFCDDLLVFKGSYNDLSDNYYKKIN